MRHPDDIPIMEVGVREDTSYFENTRNSKCPSIPVSCWFAVRERLLIARKIRAVLAVSPPPPPPYPLKKDSFEYPSVRAV